MAAGLFGSGLSTLLVDSPTTPGYTSGLPDPLYTLLPYLNLGILVILVVMLLTRKYIVPKWTQDDLAKSSDEKFEGLRQTHLTAIAELKEAQAQALQSEVERRELAERHEDEYKKLNLDLQTYQRDQLLPALMEANRIVTAYVDALSRRGGSVS